MFCVMAWYSGQNETPSGPNETHLGNLYKSGKRALELRGKNSFIATGYSRRERLVSTALHPFDDY